jgi:sugar/nucleoside kinase (ribokinase family)
MGGHVSHEFDLLVVGRPSVDLMFSGMPTWPSIGKDIEGSGFGWCAGTSFNTAAAANRLGLGVAYVATIGNDVWSRMIHQEFEVEGLPTTFLRVENHPMPAISVAMNLEGDRGFVSYWGNDESYGARLDTRALVVTEQVDARHVHAYTDETPELIAIARRRGMTVSLDAWGGPEWTSPTSLDQALASADVVLANRAEAAAMTGEVEPERALSRLAEHCGTVVVKLGAGGAIAQANDEIVHVPADEVDVVDATGAGDALNAGFLSGWLEGLPLEQSLTLGVICGTRSVGDYGGYRGCPSAAEARRLAAARGVVIPDPPR